MSDDTVTRVATIVDGLAPLADATAGEPVRADEWNALVGAVIDLARIALAGAQATNVRLDAHFAAADHEHLGAVGPTWLDATAREQLEGFRGRLDVEQDLALSRRTVVELSTRVDRLSADVESLRRQLLSVEDNDLGRLRRLDRVANTVEALSQQDADVREIRSTLHGLRTQVGMALSLRSQLSDVEGNPIDLVAMRAAVNGLSADRARLLDAAGDVVDARRVEQRLALLETRETSDAGGGDLGSGLDRFRGELLADVDARVAASVGPVADGVSDVRLQLGGLRGDLATQLTAIDDVRSRVRGAELGLTAVQRSTSGIADLTARLGQVESRVTGQGTRLDGLASLTDRIDAHDAALAAFDSVPGRLADLDSRLSAAQVLVGRLPQVEANVAALTTLRSDVQVLSRRVDEVGSVASRANSLALAHDTRLTQVEASVVDGRTRLGTLEQSTLTQRQDLTRLVDSVATIPRTTLGGLVVAPVGPIR